jgi:hypothetical protein
LESAHLFVIFSNGERTNVDDLAALTARVFREFALISRGRRESRMPSRTRGPVRKKSTRGSPPQVRPDHPAFPARMVLTVSFVLSPVTGLFATVACSFRRQLDASVGASGPHDFAVRVELHSSRASSRPSQPAPTFVTIAKRPSLEARAGRN